VQAEAISAPSQIHRPLRSRAVYALADRASLVRIATSDVTIKR
jgi:hypothetical protein